MDDYNSYQLFAAEVQRYAHDLEESGTVGTSDIALQKERLGSLVQEALGYLGTHQSLCSSEDTLVTRLFTAIRSSITRLPPELQQQFVTQVEQVSTVATANATAHEELRSHIAGLADRLENAGYPDESVAWRRVHDLGVATEMIERARTLLQDPRYLLLLMEHGDDAQVDLLVSRCVDDINRRDAGGLTILQNYFSLRLPVRVQSFQRLLNYGANPNVIDQLGRTPLHCAVGTGDLEVVDALVNAGADMEMKDRSHDTPLTLANRLFNESHVVTAYLRGCEVIRSSSRASVAVETAQPFRMPWPSLLYLGTGAVQGVVPLPGIGAAALKFIGDLAAFTPVELESVKEWALIANHVRVPLSLLSFVVSFLNRKDNLLAYANEIQRLEQSIQEIDHRLRESKPSEEMDILRTQRNCLVAKLEMERVLAQQSFEQGRRAVVGKGLGVGTTTSSYVAGYLEEGSEAYHALRLATKSFFLATTLLGVYQNIRTVEGIEEKKRHYELVAEGLAAALQAVNIILNSLPSEGPQTLLFRLEHRRIETMIEALKKDVQALITSNRSYHLSNVGYGASVALIILSCVLEWMSTDREDIYHSLEGKTYAAAGAVGAISGVLPLLTSSGMAMMRKVRGCWERVESGLTAYQERRALTKEMAVLDAQLDEHEHPLWGERMLYPEEEKMVRSRVKYIEARLRSYALEQRVAQSLQMKLTDFVGMLDELEASLNSSPSENEAIQQILRSGGIDVSGYEHNRRELILQFLARM